MTRDEQTKLFREMEKDYAARREENRHKPAGQEHGNGDGQEHGHDGGSIQAGEPGQASNPPYSDIAADKRAYAAGPEPVATSRLLTPGELAGGKSSGPVHGDTQVPGKQPLPSPGQIAEEQTTHRPEQGQGHGKEHGRGM